MALKYQSTFTGAQIQQILAAANRFLGVTNPEDREFVETITDDDYLYLSSGKWINAKKFLAMSGGGGGPTPSGESLIHIVENFSELPSLGQPGHIYVVTSTMTMYLCTKSATYDEQGQIVEKDLEVEEILTNKNVYEIYGGDADDYGVSEEEEK